MHENILGKEMNTEVPKKKWKFQSFIPLFVFHVYDFNFYIHYLFLFHVIQTNIYNA